MTTFIISGTDTDIGKTVFAAALTQALQGDYFKPIQAGLEPETDTQTVKQLTGLSDDHFHEEIYRLNTPASPHLAAQLDGIMIDTARLTLPDTNRPLVVEGAGGLLVPLTPDVLQIDIYKTWGQPLILCARTALGTINHTLLSVEALRARKIPLLGIAFIGDENTESESIILKFSKARRLGRLPLLPTLTPQTLGEAFATHFNIKDFKP